MNRLTLVLFAACVLGGCKSEPPSGTARAMEPARPLVAILDLDALVSPRGPRPFIAGERALMTVRVEGGSPPYSLQLLTSTGDPRLASGAIDLDAEHPSLEAAIDLVLHSEVASGSYGLRVRVTDASGLAGSTTSALFEVIGSDADLADLEDTPLALKVVDIAGRARSHFYQGEQIVIRAVLPHLGELSASILAEDERAFMPMQRYTPKDLRIDLPLRVPRVARVGQYRVVLAMDGVESSVPLAITGRAFPAQTTLGIEALVIRGGENLRAPRAALLRRGETLQIEALAAGITSEAMATLRLRDRSSKIVFTHELDTILASDPHPQARSLVNGSVTLPENLLPGRHTLELEVRAGDRIAALYREVELGELSQSLAGKTVKRLSSEPELLHAESQVDK